MSKLIQLVGLFVFTVRLGAGEPQPTEAASESAPDWSATLTGDWWGTRTTLASLSGARQA